MIRIELSALISKLNEQTKLALEQAASLCIEHQHHEVLFTHLLDALLDNPLADVACLLKQEKITRSQVKDELLKNYEQRGFLDTYPSFSPLLIELLQDAWMLSSAEFNQTQLRSGAIFLTALLHSERYLSKELSVLFQSINRENMRLHFSSRLTDSSETEIVRDEKSQALDALKSSASVANNSNLSKYCTDMTKQAKEGNLDPVLCRDQEIDLMIDILCRRRKNNPIVVGDVGVGKSAVIEGLALRITEGKVPEKLKHVSLLSLDLGLLQAGASVKGEFEKRVKNIISEIKQSSYPIILFIDEAHTIIGAGNQEGGTDTANLLKPALARGELSTIAATTWREYKKYFEKDAALTRRFQLIKLEEPSPEQTTSILRGLVPSYEKAHRVIVIDSALKAASELSARYLSDKKLPDKAIDVLDTACASVAINLTTAPKCITHLQSAIQSLGNEIAQIKRAELLGFQLDAERLTFLEQESASAIAKKKSLETKWREQQEIALSIIALRNELVEESELIEKNEAQQHHERIEKIKFELSTLQQEWDLIPIKERLVHPCVDHNQITQVITNWTGVPVDQMNTEETHKIIHLDVLLNNNIKGQNLAIKCIHQRLLTSYADLRTAGRPKGAFLLVGSSGVGKTETAMQIAEQLYGGKRFLTVINMSEYQEMHSVSRLIGSPPGYVGYGEGGILTEAIRKMPYSVVLLDEVEKAHKDVLNLFYQAFDKGELADGEGRVIDCKNIVFFLTSNLGYQTIDKLSGTPELLEPELLEQALYSDLTTFFQPALLARMQVVPYVPLSHETLKEITIHKLTQLKNKLMQGYGAKLVVCDSLLDEILRRITNQESGARMLESILEGEILPPVSLALLNKFTAGEQITTINLMAVENNFISKVY